MSMMDESRHPGETGDDPTAEDPALLGAAPSPLPHHPLAPLRIPGFLLFWVGNLLSNTGTWVQNVVQTFLIQQATGRAGMVGMLNFVYFGPTLFLAPLGGLLADRLDRRRLLIFTQVVAGALALALAVASVNGKPSVPLLFAVALGTGFMVAAANPAMQALIPALVGLSLLPQALALNALTFNASRALGPALGGFVGERFGYAAAFFLNSASYFLFALALLPVRVPSPPRESGPRTSIREALVNRGILRDLFLAAAAGWSIDPVITLAPAYAIKVFRAGASTTGAILGAFGAGTLLAPLTVSWARGKRLARVLPLTFSVLFLSLAAFALLAGTGSALALLPLGGLAFLTTSTLITTDLQRATTEDFRGRVMSLWAVAFLGTRPIASAADGFLADLVGVRISTVLMAGLALVAAGVAWRSQEATFGRPRPRAPDRFLPGREES